MNKLKDYFTIFIFFLIIFILFKYNYILNKSVIDAINLWTNEVFPSLFIMFILNDIIINGNILKPFTKVMKPIFNKIFNTSGDACEAFFLSFLSGTPASAFIINEMYANNRIDEVTANKLISYTYFSNPLFLYNILSLTFNLKITIKIIIIHYLSNFLIGLLLRKNKPTNLDINNNYYKKKILSILPISIKKSLDTMFLILGTITFYMIVTNIITSIITLSPFITIMIKGIMEITQSLNSLNTVNNIGIIKEITALSIISFGGFAIHTQVSTLIYNTKISYKNFFKGRIFHVLISTITYWLIT